MQVVAYAHLDNRLATFPTTTIALGRLSRVLELWQGIDWLTELCGPADDVAGIPGMPVHASGGAAAGRMRARHRNGRSTSGQAVRLELQCCMLGGAAVAAELGAAHSGAANCNESGASDNFTLPPAAMPECLVSYLAAMQTRIEEELAWQDGSSIFARMLALGRCTDDEGGWSYLACHAQQHMAAAVGGSGGGIMLWAWAAVRESLAAVQTSEVVFYPYTVLRVQVSAPACAHIALTHPLSLLPLLVAENDSSAVKRRSSRRKLKPSPQDGPDGALVARFFTSLATTAMMRTTSVCCDLLRLHQQLQSVAGEGDVGKVTAGLW